MAKNGLFQYSGKGYSPYRTEIRAFVRKEATSALGSENTQNGRKFRCSLHSSLSAVHEGQPLEQHDVLLILYQSAIERGNCLCRVALLKHLQRHVLVQQ